VVRFVVLNYLTVLMLVSESAGDIESGQKGEDVRL
jgi:hypothetical protein